MSFFHHYANNFYGSKDFIQQCFLSEKFINLIQFDSCMVNEKSESSIPFLLYLNFFNCLKMYFFSFPKDQEFLKDMSRCVSFSSFLPDI